MQKRQESDPKIGRSARALWYVAPGKCEIRTTELRDPGPDDVVIRTHSSGVSRGTESLVFLGQVPESEWSRMAAPHQEGGFPFPVKYGYALVGEVTQGAADLLGKTVFCLHPHQNECVLHRGEVIVLDGAISEKRAVLGANMETALNAVWDAGASPCDRITVVGGGVVGLLTAYLVARMPGCDVEVVDIDDKREAVCAALGARFRLPDEARGDRDIVFHASASGAGLQTALGLAGTEARIVEMSWYGSASVSVALGEAFHSRRLSLLASQVGQVSPGHRPRWPHGRRLAAALSLLKDPVIDCLLDDVCTFDDAPARLAEWLRPGAGGLCHRIQFT